MILIDLYAYAEILTFEHDFNFHFPDIIIITFFKCQQRKKKKLKIYFSNIYQWKFEIQILSLNYRFSHNVRDTEQNSRSHKNKGLYSFST